MAESTGLEDYITCEKDKSCRYFKMVKITNLKAKTAEKLVKELIDKDAVLQTDESTTFVNIADCIDTQVSYNLPPKRESSTSDRYTFLKRDLQKYHIVSERMLQNYLNEFRYKLKRIYFGKKLVDRLVIASIYPYL